MQGEDFSNTPYLSKDKSSKRNSIVTNPRKKPSAREDYYITGQETKNWHHSQTDFVTPVTPPMYSPKGPLVFPSFVKKSIYCALRASTSSSLLFLLRWSLILNSKGI